MAVVLPNIGDPGWGTTVNAALTAVDSNNTTNAAAIAAEAVARASADSGLSTSISAVSTSVTNEATARSAAVASETASRIAGDALAIPLTQRAAPSGVATLDTNSHVPLGQMGSGTPTAGKYVDGGTGAWTVLAGGGGGSTAAAITYDPSTSGLNPIPEYDVQGAIDWLNRQDVNVAEAYLMKGYKLTNDLLLACANSQPTAYAPGLAPTQQQINTVSSAAAVTLLPAYAYGMQIITLTAATPAITLPTATAGQGFMARIVQDGTGGRVPSWVGTVKWPGGAAPTITAAANAVDILQFECFVTGTWTAFRIAADVK